jgi:hypothetical protein
VLQPDKITLPYKGASDGEMITTMLSPHKMFAAIYEHSTHVFWQKFMGGDHTNVPKFWKAMETHPSFVDHPTRDSDKFRTKMIPFDLHIDGVPVTATARKTVQNVVIVSTRPVIIHLACNKTITIVVRIVYVSYTIRIRYVYDTYSLRVLAHVLTGRCYHRAVR